MDYSIRWPQKGIEIDSRKIFHLHILLINISRNKSLFCFRNWNKELENADGKKHKASLKRAIFKTFGKSYAVYGIYLFIQVIILRYEKLLIISSLFIFSVIF